MKTQEILSLAKEIFSKNANEFETRKKLIDVILESVLGWGFQDISYEERVSEDGNTTFADYIIRTADVAILVEAKRVSANFVFNSSKRKVKLIGSIMQ
jgi:predicted type IV restriction endonuclease